jgi:hypothetical protein
MTPHVVDKGKRMDAAIKFQEIGLKMPSLKGGTREYLFPVSRGEPGFASLDVDYLWVKRTIIHCRCLRIMSLPNPSQSSKLIRGVSHNTAAQANGTGWSL